MSPPRQGTVAVAVAMMLLLIFSIEVEAVFVQPYSFFTVTVKLPALRPVKVGSLWKSIPLIE